MEKLIYTLSESDVVDPDALAKALQEAGASKVRINLRDEHVEPAAGLVQRRGHDLPDLVVQVWLPNGNPAFRQDVDKLVADHCKTFHAWLVSEAQIIANGDHPPQPGERTHGFAQLAFLTLPKGMEWSEWRSVWRDRHTPVAIETQSNFEYVQNLVVEPLTEKASPFVAIVEECFPPEAMTDPTVFFDAAGDKVKFERNLGAMMESCNRFITPGTIDVFPTSQYDFGQHDFG